MTYCVETFHGAEVDIANKVDQTEAPLRFALKNIGSDPARVGELVRALRSGFCLGYLSRQRFHAATPCLRTAMCSGLATERIMKRC